MKNDCMRQIIGAVLSVVIATSATCTSAQTSASPAADASAQPGTAAAPQHRRRSDTTVANDVRRALVRTSGLNSMNIQVRVRGGIVTLTGWVPERSQINRASRAAWSVRGVRSVSNQLAVRTNRMSGR